MDVDNNLFYLFGEMMLVFGLVFSLVVILPIFFLRKNNDAVNIFHFLIEKVFDLKMFTVLLIVISSSFLAFTGIIDGTAAVAILSGIVGYVLGGIKRE